MSVTAEIETRSRTNVLAVPIASVTTRLPKDKSKKNDGKTNAAQAQTNSPAVETNSLVGSTNSGTADGTNTFRADKKKEAPKPVEVVFVMDGDHAKMSPVKIGISDDTHWEITEGLTEGQEVVSGGYRAISRHLEDGKKIRKGPPAGQEKDGEPKKAE